MPARVGDVRRTTVHLLQDSFDEIDAILAEYDVKANEVIRAAVAIGLEPKNRAKLLASLGPVIEPPRGWTSQRITWLARKLGSPDAQTTQLDDGGFALAYASQATAAALRKHGLRVHTRNGILMVWPKEEAVA